MKKTIRFFAALLMLSVLSGCAFKSGDELLKTPKPPKDYQALETELQKMLDSSKGMLYAAPKSGEYRSTVQLKDLDADGEDEAIAFFRESSQSSTYYVVVYKKVGSKYIKMGTVVGNATAIAAVDYPVFTPAGKCGIVIAWKLTGESTTGLTVCSFEGTRFAPILETEYLDYKLLDLTSDGRRELVTINADAAGKKTARMYAYIEHEGAPSTMELRGEAPLAYDAKTVVGVKAGYVSYHRPALFVEEKNDSGVGLLTDIFLYDSAGFRNIAPETGQNEAYSTYRLVSVYAADANGDGITEIPRARLIPGYQSGAADALYFLDWYVYGAEQPAKVSTTYTSLSEEWQLTVPDSWSGMVTVTRTSSTSGISSTTFEVYNPAGNNTPLLRIYRLTDVASRYLTDRDDIHTLRETGSAIYAAEIPTEAASSALALTLSQVEECFKLVAQGWAE